MADSKTHLRELSVATTVGLLKMDIDFRMDELFCVDRLYSYAERLIENDITTAKNILEDDISPIELQLIVKNGYKLGLEIYKNKNFDIKQNTPIKWVGNDTQKGNPVDIIIGQYGFSLKEESFILKNMGLYQLLNTLTGSNYKKGLHVFETFAPEEYNEWFNCTWKLLLKYLNDNLGIWEEKNQLSEIRVSEDTVIMFYDRDYCNIPRDIVTINEYKKHTTSKIREKVFAKWINKEISSNEHYVKTKKACSEIAGKRVSELIQQNFSTERMYDFFQIMEKEYYYAKTTASETTILKVPSKEDFHKTIEFLGCRYEVPGSQLNIITTFKNKSTGKILEFRNECRFSHGQFNGTPEAKMYVAKNTSLTNLYQPF